MCLPNGGTADPSGPLDLASSIGLAGLDRAAVAADAGAASGEGPGNGAPQRRPALRAAAVPIVLLS
jgi:hypothetical protein